MIWLCYLCQNIFVIVNKRIRTGKKEYSRSLPLKNALPSLPSMVTEPCSIWISKINRWVN